MDWRLNDARPIWIQLTDRLTERIVSGEYDRGSKMPTVRELAADARVNPNTMQRALTELDSRGLTETNRTSGRSVTDDQGILEAVRKELAQAKLNEFLKGMETLGYEREEIAELLKGEELR